MIPKYMTDQINSHYSQQQSGYQQMQHASDAKILQEQSLYGAAEQVKLLHFNESCCHSTSAFNSIASKEMHFFRYRDSSKMEIRISNGSQTELVPSEAILVHSRNDGRKTCLSEFSKQEQDHLLKNLTDESIKIEKIQEKTIVNLYL